MQSDSPFQIDPDPSIGQQINRMDRTIQNQQFLIQSLIKSFLKNSSSISQDDSLKKELTQINQRYEDVNEQIILETATFSAYDTAFSQIQNRINQIEKQLRHDEKEENPEEEEKDLLIENMKVDIECLKEQFENLTNSDERSSSKNTISILKTAFMTKFKKMKNHLKAYQESTNKAISNLRADLDNLEMNGQEYHQEFTRLNSKIQNFQITLNYLRDQLNISDDQGIASEQSSQIKKEIESIKESIDSIQQKCVLREDAQEYENKVNSIREKLAQFPLVAAQQEKCARDVFNIQNEIDQLKNSQVNSTISVSADYQSKLNSLLESQQKNDETLKKVRKVVSTLKSDMQELKQNNQQRDEKVVTRDIQISEESPKIETTLNKVKSNLDKQYRKSKQNETQINKINDDINHIQQDIESIYTKLNHHERPSSQSNQNDDYTSLKREIKKLKNEVNALKSEPHELDNERQSKHSSDHILQRVNQLSSDQAILNGQFNKLLSHLNQIKEKLDNLDARLNEDEEKNNSEIELINQKVDRLTNDIDNHIPTEDVENPPNPSVKERSVNLDNTDNQDDESIPSNIENRIQVIENNMNALRTRTESVISNQNKLVAQFNTLVPQLQQMKDQLINLILQDQTKNASLSTFDEDIDNDDQANTSGSNVFREINSLNSRVDKIEKALGSGDELSASFLNKVRTEVNQLEREIANVKSNTPDVSTSGFKNQSNQITKLQRQYHNLKRSFEKHLVLSANAGNAQEGSFHDDEDSEELSDNSLSNLINANATAGTKMQNSILDAIEKRMNEIKTYNEIFNSNIERKVEKLEKKVEKLSQGVSNNDYNNSPSDENLYDRVNNIENKIKDLDRANKSLTKDSNNIHLIVDQIQESVKPNNFSERGIKSIQSSKKSIGSPKSEKDAESIDKKLSQLYVQVNSYYSNITNLSKSLEELTQKFEELRNDVDALMRKSPHVNNRLINRDSKKGKNDDLLNDPDYSNEYNEEND